MPRIMTAKEVQTERTKWLEHLVRKCQIKVNEALCEGFTQALIGIAGVEGQEAAPVFGELFGDCREILLRDMQEAGLTNPAFEKVENQTVLTPQSVGGIKADVRVTHYRISWDAQVDLTPPERGVEGLPVGKVSVH